ncbi:MAG: alpha/beta fold hydrolase [Lysobacterales bacterium]
MSNAQAQALIEALGYTPKYFTRDGLSMHYLDEGKGAPVVMVHGNPSWCWLFRDLIAALKPNYRCVAPDHIGMGLSDRPDDARYQYTLDSRVADFSAFMERIVPTGPVTLVVHDWGGAIASAWAVKNPDRVARMVVLNTAAFPMLAGKRLPATLKLVRNTRLGAFLVERFNAFAVGAARTSTARKLSGRERAAFVAPYDSPIARRAVLRFVQDIPLRESDPAYATIAATGKGLQLLADKPMLILWGLRDFVFDRDYFDEWCRRFPRAEAIAFADAGHYVLEDMAATIVPKIEAFLAKS